MAQIAAEVGSTANRYQILAKLAAGGMAEIFLARGASVAGVERYCVLKRIRRERAGNLQLVRMFFDEARLASQLQHPNIASVYDVGVLGDSYFFTMEYVHGETIRSLLQRTHELRRPIPLACVLTIIAGAAAGLHHAHERNANDGSPLGIVHRDVSPSNVMVSFEGNVKVVDFGLAKAADRTIDTHSVTVKGKINYLSPEQCRVIRVDRRSDLFSLGIVMWEMLTGARLYHRVSDFDTMTAIVHEPPPPPSSLRREIPGAIDGIVLRLLAKDVGERFQTAAAVVEAIEDASVRAGTILSTSAVSRLIRDLFGVRDVPWLEIERDAVPHEAVTLLVPTTASVVSSGVVEAELVSDLSSPSMVETGVISAWDRMLTPHAGAPVVPVTAPAQAAAPPAGEAAPSAHGRGAPVVPSSARSSAPPARGVIPAGAPTPVTLLAPPVEPDSALDATILSDPPPEAVASASEQIAVPVPELAPSAAASSTLLGVAAPPAGAKEPPPAPPAPKPPPPPPRVATAAPAPIIAEVLRPFPERIASVLRPMPVLSSVASSSSLRTPRRGLLAWASRLSRRQLAAVVLAIVIGAVIVVRLVIAGPSGRSAPAADLAATPGPAGDAGVRHALRTGPGSDPPAGGDSPDSSAAGAASEAPPDAGAPPRSDPPRDERSDAAAITITVPVRNVGSTTPPRAASSPRGTPAPRGEAAPRPRPAADADPSHRAPAEKSPASPTPASVATGRAAPAPEPLAQLPLPSPPAGESMAVWLSKLYHQADYTTIVQVCSGTKVTPDIASVCVLAACQDQAVAKAKLWLAKVAKTSRDTAAARCKTLGNIDLQNN